MIDIIIDMVADVVRKVSKYTLLDYLKIPQVTILGDLHI
jgi:hypothetical protein